MIKINLFLTRKEKKKMGAKRETFVFLFSVILLILLLFGVHWLMDQNIKAKRAEIADTKNQIAHHKSLMMEVTKYKELHRTYQERLNTIETLRKERAVPAKVLDELSVGKPEKLHFDSMKKEGPRVGVEGVALDDETVANFMDNLRKSTLFRNIDLVISEQIEQSKIKLKKFILSFEIVLR
jgi:type IV pilus assembly protein PilN